MIYSKLFWNYNYKTTFFFIVFIIVKCNINSINIQTIEKD